MASKVIAFRFSDEEIETLQRQGQEGESPSQIAQRVLRGALGIDAPSLQGVDNVNELVKRLVDERLTGLQVQIEKRITAEIEARLGELAA